MKVSKPKRDLIALFITAIVALLLGDWINQLEGADLIKHLIVIGFLFTGILAYFLIDK